MHSLGTSGKEFNPAIEKTGLIAKASNALFALKFICKNGIPNRIYRFGGGLGDHLMVSTVFKEWRKRGGAKQWMMSDFPEIFFRNPDVSRVVPDHWRIEKLCSRFGKMPILLKYGEWIGDPDRINPPKKHIIAEILTHSGLSGSVTLRPYYYAVRQHTPEEHLRSQILCIQGTNSTSTTPMANKQWLSERFASVGEKLSNTHRLIQIGLKGESDISAAEDMRGRLSIPETADLLARSSMFIGQVGFLMHLARAVGTRSVIVYGGREKSSQSGYPCNENLETHPECSPCWRNNDCEYNRKCLDDIHVQDVLDAVDRLKKRLPETMETETCTL